VRLQNGLPEATNIHWHGLAAPPEMDGFPSDVVAPGGARDYRFRIVQRAGTYWYHRSATTVRNSGPKAVEGVPTLGVGEEAPSWRRLTGRR